MNVAWVVAISTSPIKNSPPGCQLQAAGGWAGTFKMHNDLVTANYLIEKLKPGHDDMRMQPAAFRQNQFISRRFAILSA
jgi:hypothetical protein